MPQSSAVSSQTTPQLEITRVVALKGLAILAVVLVHILASIKLPIYWQSPWQPWTVFLDQLSRFSVPLFVALSGYTLMSKYGKKPTVVSFWQRRVLKLLPQYGWWVVIITLAILAVPTWQWPDFMSDYVGKVVFGHADYHLYFVPMIFQLYLLFPFLARLMKAWWGGVVGFAAVWHILWIYHLSVTSEPAVLGFSMGSDQLQYVFFGTWLWYFILGMAAVPHTTKERAVFRRYQGWLVVGAVAMAVAGLSWAVSVGLSNIQAGVDPIDALKFTRWPIALYATGIVVASLVWVKKSLSFPLVSQLLHPVQLLLVSLGSWSYVIYLSHTLLLRLFFSYHYHTVPLEQLVLPLGLLVIGLVVSAKQS